MESIRHHCSSGAIMSGEFKEISKRPVSPWLKRMLPFWEIELSTDIELSDYVAINEAEVNVKEEELVKLIGGWKTDGEQFTLSNTNIVPEK